MPDDRVCVHTAFNDLYGYILFKLVIRTLSKVNRSHASASKLLQDFVIPELLTLYW